MDNFRFDMMKCLLKVATCRFKVVCIEKGIINFIELNSRHTLQETNGVKSKNVQTKYRTILKIDPFVEPAPAVAFESEVKASHASVCSGVKIGLQTPAACLQ